MIPFLAKRLAFICAFLVGVFWIIITVGTPDRSVLYISSIVVVCLGSLYMLLLCIYPVQQRQLQWARRGTLLGIIVAFLVQLISYSATMPIYSLPLAFLGFMLGRIVDEARSRHTVYRTSN